MSDDNNNNEVVTKTTKTKVAKVKKQTLREKTEGVKLMTRTDMLKDYAMLEELGAKGLSIQQIAEFFSIHPRTLLTHRKLDPEIDFAITRGKMKANITVANALFKNATENNNVTSQIFWLKAQAGWKDTSSVELTGANGGAIEITAVRERLAEKLAQRNKDAE